MSVTVRPAEVSRSSPAPGLRPPARAVSNGFVVTLGGPNPPLAAGSFLQQLRQATALAGLVGAVEQSVASGGREPPDFAVAAKLRALDFSALSGEAAKHSTAEYTSTVPNASPAAVFEHLLTHPSECFAAAGLTLRPAPARLEDGARLMIEDPSARSTRPPLWLPVEVRVDEAKRQVGFLTLDGHPLRGSNSFQLESDGQGGTVVHQGSRFQQSSAVTALGARLTGAVEHQHQVWRAFHDGLYKHFNP